MLLRTFFITLLIAVSMIQCNEHTKTEVPQEKLPTTVEMVTTHGTMIIELSDKTPLHRDNFINLAKNKAYDSLLFHRVIKDFMIQGGDPDSRKAKPSDTLGDGDAPYVVPQEINFDLFHKKGVLAAARDNNPERSSSAMQFYIVQGKVFNDSLLLLANERINKGKAVRDYKTSGKHASLIDSIGSAMKKSDFKRYFALQDSIWTLAKKDSNFVRYTIPENQRVVYKTIGGTPHLDQNYTVFGEVIEGLNVIDSIANKTTNTLDRPINDVRILSVRLRN